MSFVTHIYKYFMLMMKVKVLQYSTAACVCVCVCMIRSSTGSDRWRKNANPRDKRTRGPGFWPIPSLLRSVPGYMLAYSTVY